MWRLWVKIGQKVAIFYKNCGGAKSGDLAKNYLETLYFVVEGPEGKTLRASVKVRVRSCAIYARVRVLEVRSANSRFNKFQQDPRNLIHFPRNLIHFETALRICVGWPAASQQLNKLGTSKLTPSMNKAEL